MSCSFRYGTWQERRIYLRIKADLGLSDDGFNFLGGLMKNAKSIVAITNPTINSYKRINVPVTQSGATWAPNTITWSGNNRTHMVRIPGPGRFEETSRWVDQSIPSASNYYSLREQLVSKKN